MNKEEVDVLVIGGGPAGATCAALTARTGLSVRVLEGKDFPRHHIGESLLAMSMPLLDNLGVLPAMDAAGFLPKTGGVFVWGPERRRVDLGFPRPNRAYQVRRAQFDQLLLQHAGAVGANVWPSQWVKTLVKGDDSRIRGVVSDGRYGRTEHLAKLVVDASGLFQFVPKRLGLPLDVSGSRRVALSAYYRGASRVRGEQANNVISEATRDGWVWFIPLDGDTTSVGFVGDEIDLHGTPAQMLRAQLESGLVADLLEGAERMGTVKLLRYTNHVVASPLWTNGYALTGDTALFVDPLFSTGVHGALYSGTSAAAGIVSYLLHQEDEATIGRWYDRTMRSHYARVQTMVGLLYGINSGSSRFWASRDLRQVDHAEAEEIAARLGPISAPFFQAGHADGSLDLPPALAPLLTEFVSSPDPRAVITAGAVRLANCAGLEETFARRGDRLVSSVRVFDQRSRCHPIEVARGTRQEALIRQMMVGRVPRELWTADGDLSALVAVLVTSGLAVECQAGV